MVNITLQGILGKKFGKFWELEVETVMEIFEAIEVNTSKVSDCFKDVQKFCTHFIVLVDGEVLPPYLINSKVLEGKKNIEILPVIQGGGFFAMFLIGIALTVLSMVITKMMSPKKPKDVKTSSSVLGSIRNVTSRNHPVPIGYGRLRVGSFVVANNLQVDNTAADLWSEKDNDSQKSADASIGFTNDYLGGYIRQPYNSKV